MKGQRYRLYDHGFADIEVYNASLSRESLIHRFRRLHGLPRGSSFSGGRVLWSPLLEVIAREKQEIPLNLE
ncbi:MAG: hypothetical protein U9Q84_02260 [Thermodesulfobacteriota bacterium]|nr:hypothetical protein [Thermodesulfobacteriota bacterium]